MTLSSARFISTVSASAKLYHHFNIASPADRKLLDMVVFSLLLDTHSKITLKDNTTRSLSLNGHTSAFHYSLNDWPHNHPFFFQVGNSKKEIEDHPYTLRNEGLKYPYNLSNTEITRNLLFKSFLFAESFKTMILENHLTPEIIFLSKVKKQP